MKFFLLVLCVATLTQCSKTPDLKFSKIKFINSQGEEEAIKVGNGQKTVVHFFAHWCGDCLREMPDANQMLKNAPEDIRVYYLTDSKEEEKAKMEQRFKIPFPTYTLSGTLKENGVRYLPLNYFIDEDGQQILAQAEKIDWHSEEIKTFLGYKKNHE